MMMTQGKITEKILPLPLKNSSKVVIRFQKIWIVQAKWFMDWYFQLLPVRFLKYL